MNTFEELALRAFIASTSTAQFKLFIKPYNKAIDEYSVYCRADEFMSVYAQHQNVGTITKELIHG